MSGMRDFQIKACEWDKLADKFNEEKIEYTVATSHAKKNHVVVMVEKQHASKALGLILKSN